MTKPYQLSIPTGFVSESKDILATVDKACGSGSGPSDCIDITCRVCISFTLDFTFGGVLAGIGTITITGVDTGSQYLWEDPPASSPTATIPTSCGGLRIFFQIAYDGSATLQIRLNGVLIVSRTSSMRVCEPFVPGDPTEFVYPQPLVDGSEEEGYGPDFTVSGNEDGCNGDASITVTNSSGGGAGSGSVNPYDFALDTLFTEDDVRILAAVDCAAAGSGPNRYWYGVDTGFIEDGKRVLWAYNPCCNDPEFFIQSNCTPSLLIGKKLTLTIIGTTATEGPYTLTYVGPGLGGLSRWEINGTAENDGCLLNPNGSFELLCYALNYYNGFALYTTIGPLPFLGVEPPLGLPDSTYDPLYLVYTFPEFTGGPTYCGYPIAMVITE